MTCATMASEEVQKLVEIPVPVQPNCGGFALDFGSSFLKVVYIHKETDKKNPRTSQLGLATFPVRDLDTAVRFIKDHCSLSGDGGRDGVPLVYATGVSNSELTKKLEASLNIRLVSLPKMQCFARGFAYLGRTTRLSAYLENAIQDHRQWCGFALQMWPKWNEFNKYPWQLHCDPVRELAISSREDCYARSLFSQEATQVTGFPCLLVVCGSRCHFIKVYANGDYDFLDATDGGNAAFVVLGSMLSGAKTFQDLSKLADGGDSKQVDIGLFDFQERLASTNDVYASVVNSEKSLDQVVYCFGKAPGKSIEDFKREDMTRALLHVVVMDLVQSTLNMAYISGLDDVVFCGSFLNMKVARELLSAKFTEQKVNMLGFVGKASNLNVHFVQHAAHIGALGALVSTPEEQP